MEAWVAWLSDEEAACFLFWRSLLYNEEKRLWYRHSITEVRNVVERFLSLVEQRVTEEFVQAQKELKFPL